MNYVVHTSDIKSVTSYRYTIHMIDTELGVPMYIIHRVCMYVCCFTMRKLCRNELRSTYVAVCLSSDDLIHQRDCLGSNFCYFPYAFTALAPRALRALRSRAVNALLPRGRVVTITYCT